MIDLLRIVLTADQVLCHLEKAFRPPGSGSRGRSERRGMQGCASLGFRNGQREDKAAHQVFSLDTHREIPEQAHLAPVRLKQAACEGNPCAGFPATVAVHHALDDDSGAPNDRRRPCNVGRIGPGESARNPAPGRPLQ